ncbi:MAG: hypothetical protein ABJK37_07100 [Paraglaciecola sp.]|uniref:hypothetical protein n=1 Tax=Paraglaciecola sp. TaxID=1920173 RepID=UPI003297F1B9
MCGATVSTIEGDNIHAMPFLGFKQLSESKPLKGCVITHVEAYTSGDGLACKWVEGKQHDWLLGHVEINGVYLVIQDEKPINLGFGVVDNYKFKEGNVVSLLD